MTKSVLLAGLIGGLLGGIGGFVLFRTFPAPAKPVTIAEPPRGEARERADDLIAKLKARRDDDFFATLRAAFVESMNDEEFAKVRDGLIKLREKFAGDYGPVGDYEFGAEAPLGPSVVRFTYVEKHERGCVVCFVVFYNTPTGWRVLAFSFHPLDAAFGAPR